MWSILALAITVTANYDTILEKKCVALKGKWEVAAYVAGSCFVATNDEKNVNFDEWPTLHKDCVMLNGYKGHMAYIKNEKMIDKLTKSGVIANQKRYYIGARQFPQSVCQGGPCQGEEHAKNWFFFDENNKNLGPVDKALWGQNEPNNEGSPPETVATLESFDNYKLGLNDANPQKQKFQTLCQFVDFLSCPDDYTLIRDKCYKINQNKLSASGAVAACQKEGGVLASIHDDAMNAMILGLTLEEFADIADPLRFGLKYDNKWNNDDGTPADYFRWFDKAGCGNPTPFKNGGVRAALGVSAVGRKPDPSYWIVANDSDLLPFVCQKNPEQAYPDSQ